MSPPLSSFLILILSFHTLLILTTSNTNTPKTYIISIQNDLKPSKTTDIKQWYHSILSYTQTNSSSSSNSKPDFIHIYSTAFHGFSAQLTPQQVTSLKTRPEVTAIYPDQILHPFTTRTPHFLDLDSYHFPTGLLKDSNVGSNVVIGVVDTGIWPNSTSFSDDGLGPVPTHFRGECKGGKDFPPCDRKIVGVRYFSSGMKAMKKNQHHGHESEYDYKYDSALDDHEGHGTHTASTMAGRARPKASFFGYAKGEATGIAPSARLAIYKVCWSTYCSEADILAGVDKAVEDNVDVISFSIGGPSPHRYSDDSVSIAAFAAAEKGILFSASAGNNGPSSGRVTNTAPWVTTVGASTIDRRFIAVLKMGNGDSFTGTSLYTGRPLHKKRTYPLVHITTNSSTRLCTPDAFHGKTLRGKIVVCQGDPMTISVVHQGVVVHKAGGVGVVVASSDPDLLTSEPFIYPGLTVPLDASVKIMEYIKNHNNTSASIIFRGTVIGHKPDPIVAPFSSRGPSITSSYVLKPDLIAPGVEILAAWPNNLAPTKLPDDHRRTKYNIISGTSMSCPHVSGVAALLKGSHPDWTPSMIRSALMTTAYKGYHDVNPSSSEQQYINKESPWDIGAGHIDPERANDPGLVFELDKEDYIRFLCASNYTELELKMIVKGTWASCNNTTTTTTTSKTKTGNGNGNGNGNPWDINYPAIVVRSDTDSVVTRTLTNVDVNPGNYRVKVVQPEGADVSVEPMELKFETKGEKERFSVTVRPSKSFGLLKRDTVGLITWTDGKHNVTIPLIVHNEDI